MAEAGRPSYPAPWPVGWINVPTTDLETRVHALRRALLH